MPINANGKLRVKGVGQIGPILTEFISVWDTSFNNDAVITLPLVASGNYNFSVNWGDGTTDTITSWNQPEVTHNYEGDGVKTLTITGTIEGWSFNGSIEAIKLTSITNIGPLKLGNEGSYFAGCLNLTTIGGTFDLTGTTNFSSLFEGCSLLTSVNGIGSWNVSAVTDMNRMFASAISFNQDISGWNTAAVTNMSYMFASAISFNQDISGWNTAAVTDMNRMFSNTIAFNQDISGWDVSSVTNMYGMFNSATAFNQDISGWNTSAVTNMSYMFANATSFNGDISLWDVSNVTNMNGVFYEATSFNQDISSWNISNVTNMPDFMFGKSTANYSYYDNLLNSWSLLTLQNGVEWGMGTIEYTAAGATARQDIIDNYSWTITDGGLAA